MIEDLRGDESWRMFRIISEFTEGFDKLSDHQVLYHRALAENIASVDIGMSQMSYLDEALDLAEHVSKTRAAAKKAEAKKGEAATGKRKKKV